MPETVEPEFRPLAEDAVLATLQYRDTTKGEQRVLRINIRPPQTAPPTEQPDSDSAQELHLKGEPISFRRIRRREFTVLGTTFLFSLMSILKSRLLKGLVFWTMDADAPEARVRRQHCRKRRPV